MTFLLPVLIDSVVCYCRMVHGVFTFQLCIFHYTISLLVGRFFSVLTLYDPELR